MKIKKFVERIYLFLVAFFSYNPLQKPQLEHFEFFSPNGKLQRRIETKIDENANRATRRAFGFENFENFDDYDDLEDNFDDYEELEEMSGRLSSYEMENYEREFLEEYENLARRGARKPRSQARKKVMNKYGKRGRSWAYLATKKSPVSLTGGQKGGEVATFTINAFRVAVSPSVAVMNIQQDLPVEIFNVIDNYADNAVLKRYLPAGVVLLSSNTDATRTNWEFFFQQGANIDKVVISCSEISYNKLQLATQNDLFRIGRTLYKISDKNQQQAFSQKFVVVTQSLFGFGKENPITLTNYIDPINFREDSVIITTAFDIDKQSGIVMGIPYVVGAPTFRTTLGVSVSRFDQWNRTKMGR